MLQAKYWGTTMRFLQTIQLYRACTGVPPCASYKQYSFTGQVLGYHHALPTNNTALQGKYWGTTMGFLQTIQLYRACTGVPPWASYKQYSFTGHVLGYHHGLPTNNTALQGMYWGTTMGFLQTIQLYRASTGVPPCASYKQYSFTGHVLGYHHGLPTNNTALQGMYWGTTMRFLQTIQLYRACTGVPPCASYKQYSFNDMRLQ